MTTAYTPATPNTRAISNGQLLAMESTERSEAIRALSPRARRQLAHIATLGAAKLSRDALKLFNTRGRAKHAQEKLKHSIELTELAAELTAAYSTA